MRILLVDDSRAARSILRNMLKGLDVELIEAEDGQEALDKLSATGPVDLALIDWNMPVMDGYELVCALRSDRAYDAMPLMMVTAETEMEQVVKALGAGANEFVMKPFSREVIYEKLALLGVEIP